MIRCPYGGPAPCVDDLCRGSRTLCGLDMDFEAEMVHHAGECDPVTCIFDHDCDDEDEQGAAL